MLPSYKPTIGQIEVSVISGNVVLINKDGASKNNISSAYLFWSCMHSGISLKTVII